VVLYGNSLLIAGVEASLRGRPDLDVVRIDTALSDAGTRLNALRPDVVIFDLIAPHYSEFAIPFLREHPGLPLIGLDPNSKTVTVLSNQRYTALTVNELAQVIQMQIRRQGGKVDCVEEEEP
jgi:hypothetical protein